MSLFYNTIYMAFGLCKYKNAFGQLGQGIHSYRLGKGLIGANGIAILDFGVTALFALLISYLLDRPFWITFLLIIIIGIILHRIFCVRTAVDVLLFPDSKDHE